MWASYLSSINQHRGGEPGTGDEKVWVQLRLPGSPGFPGLLREEESKESERQQQLFEGAAILQLGPVCIAGSSSC